MLLDLTRNLTMRCYWHAVTIYFSVISVIYVDQSGRAVYRSDTGIMGSNPSQGIDHCLYLFCVHVW
jgi:hypothetical protein